MEMLDDIARVLISEDDLKKRVAELGRELSELYSPQDQPLLVCILKGAFVFLADLTRSIDIPHEVDFMVTTSYGTGTESSGVVRILLDLERNIEDRHVLIVEDIVDTGYTLEYIARNLRTRGPASVKVCALLSKPARRKVDVSLDFVGFEVPDEFVVGYGMDYAEVYRNLPFVGVLKESVYGRTE